MAIYRGTGGSGDSTQDSTLNEVTQQAINAADSATAASNSASDSSTSAGQSSTSATNAANSATASANSATASSNSKDTSASQATIATTKASAAGTSATNAAASASTASTQATNSANSATASANSATASANSATAAAASASTATTKASEAATSATNAATSNTNSGNSATASANSATAAASSASGASTSASTATTKASEASTSASNAASSLATFTGQYVSQSSAPSSPSTGDLWFDTSAAIMKVYNGSGWVSAGSSVSGVENSVQYTATSNQTSFNATYDAGYLQVYLNGIRLDAEDYTATNGSTVVLDTGATVNDVVFIHSFGTFELADHYNKVASDARYEPIDSAYTKAEADANLAALVDSSPAALNTLNELAAALGDDANFSTTVTNSIATKLPLAGGTMTGVIAGFTSTGIDDNATSTAITIDSSERVVIGATVQAAQNAVTISSAGYVQARATGVAGYFDRIGSDGSVLEIRKSGTTVGSIGTNGSRPYLTNPTYGGISVADYRINPVNASGAAWDNALNLGAGGSRWKDLYLSGGVYLGGTGAANKLDDYETGSWNPTLASSGGTDSGRTYSATPVGTYVKVGKLVTLTFEINCNGAGTLGTGEAVIKGIPFTPHQKGSGTFAKASAFAAAKNAVALSVETNNVRVYLMQSSGESTTVLGYIAPSGWGTPSVWGTMQYTTNE